MKHFLLLGCAALSAALPAAARPAHPGPAQARLAEPFKWAPAPKGAQQTWQGLKPVASAQKAPVSEATRAFTPSENIAYLDMPDGKTWFVTCDYDKSVLSENEYFTDYDITGIHATIYNELGETVGRINAEIPKPDGFEKCSAVQFGPAVTKKFFNTDDNYEVMVMANFKPIDDYGATPYTFVYSLKGASTDAKLATTLNGYYTSAINGAADAWSEDFVMEFFSGESYTDTQILYSFDIYGKASYSSPEARLLHSFEIDMLKVMSDGENEPIPVMANLRGNDLYVTVATYEKTFFEDPFDFTNDNLSPDNNYRIELWRKAKGETELALAGITSIPCDEPDPGYYMKTYALGIFEGYDDITFDFTADAEPAFIISIVDTDINENTYTRFCVVDREGAVISRFGEGSEGFLHLSSVPGQPEQFCFLMPTGNEDEVEFRILDYPSFATVATIPPVVEIDGVPTLLSLSMDRAAWGSSCRYALAAVHGAEDEVGNTYHEMAWFDADGTYSHTDRLNAGRNINMINPYVSGRVLVPHLFNTDHSQEYIVFALRRDNEEQGAAHTELMVVNDREETLMQYLFDQTAASIAASIVNTGTHPAVWITYRSFEDGKYHSEFIDLPLNNLQGAGTAENPYLLRTPGDIDLISRNLNANFRIANDIDFSDAQLKNVSGVFTGSIDGAGHAMRHFTLDGAPWFSTVGNLANGRRSFLRDLTLEGVKATGTPAIVARTSYAADFSGLRIRNANVTAAETSEFGTITANAAMGSVISDCYVHISADCPEAGFMGGFTATLGNDSKILASAFKGSLTAAECLGGAAGSTFATSTIADCHIDADLTASHTVGGVAGTSARGLITRCVVEGNLTATSPRTRHSDYTGGTVKLINVGGIAGELQTAPTEYDDQGNPLPPDPTSPAVISHCVVAHEAINIPEEEELKATAHRIVGFSNANHDPEILEENYNPQTGDWDIVWGDPAAAEDKLEHNYAHVSFNNPASPNARIAPVDPSVEVAHNSVEGETLPEGAINPAWLESHGFAFGNETNSPWVHSTPMESPLLWFENAAKLTFTFDPAVISIPAGQSATVALLYDHEFAHMDLTTEFSSSDPQACVVTPVSDFEVEIRVLKRGEYIVTATFGDFKADLLVMGTSDVELLPDASSSKLTYSNGILSAPGLEIALYASDGVLIARGQGHLATASLPAGVYIASTGGSVIKIRK